MSTQTFISAQEGAKRWRKMIRDTTNWGKRQPNVVRDVHAQYAMKEMRDANTDEHKLRRPDDEGPLRLVTGRLLRSIIGKGKSLKNFPNLKGRKWKLDYGVLDEGHFRVNTIFTPSGFKMMIKHGSRTPYAGIHEYGGFTKGRGKRIRIVRRPYFHPGSMKGAIAYRKSATAELHVIVFKDLWGLPPRTKNSG